MKNLQKHRKNSLRLKEYDYSQKGAYFLTICTKNRGQIFGKIKNYEFDGNEIAKICKGHWLQISKYTLCILDEFVIMPDHIHGIIFIKNSPVGAIHESPLPRNMIIPKIIGKFKMQSAKEINGYLKTEGQSFWQRGYYDHIIRDEDDLNRIREYIVYNPMKWDEDANNLK